MSDIFDRLGIRRLINASGTETPFGASPILPEVIDAVREIASHSVFMTELQEAASRTIAEYLSCEAGCVTGCTAASIATAVAAAMTGADLGKVEQLPDTAGMKNEVIMQRGHEVSYGQNVSQNIRIAGARVVEIGAATQSGLYQLTHAINDRTCAALYVVSHLTVQNRLIPLKDFVAECHKANVPVIVDAASMPDPRVFLQSGADLVFWSAQKAFSSFTAGIVAGRKDLVHAMLYQDHGIGRPMKVGKEGVVAAIAALHAWSKRDTAAEDSKLNQRIERVMDRLKGLNGTVITKVGKQIKLKVDPKQTTSASAVAAYLEASEPAIVVWSHFAPEGELYMSLGKLDDAQADQVISKIEEALQGAADGFDSKYVSIGEAYEHRIANWSP